MKRLILIFAFFSAIALFGEPIDENTAYKIALNIQKAKNALHSTIGEQPELVYKCVPQSIVPPHDETAYYYVFNYGDKGFVMISGDDRALPILGYSNEGGFNPDKIPSNARKWFEGYEEQIKTAVELNIQPDENLMQKWENVLNPEKRRDMPQRIVSPLIKTTWNQYPYYNDLCPYDDEVGKRTVTGCVATAMAQIMKYWEYPETGVGSKYYTHKKYGKLSANFGETTYEWDQMPNSIDSENTPIATLMYHCGVSTNMNYGTAESGGSSASVYAVINALQTYFKYRATMEITRQKYTDYEWVTMIKNEIDLGRPIFYVVSENYYFRHAIVADGYDEDGLIHLNYGWGGVANGYYAINDISTYQYIGWFFYYIEKRWNKEHSALLNIVPTEEFYGRSLALEKNIEISASKIEYLSPINVSAYISNSETSAFNGEICVAVFDNNRNLIELTDVQPLINFNATSENPENIDFSFNSNVLTPGDYKLRIYYKSGNDNWEPVCKGENSEANNDYISITVENTDVIELNSEIEIISENVYKESEIEIWLDVRNKTSEIFDGDFMLTLDDVYGETADTVGLIWNCKIMPNSSRVEGLTFKKDILTAPPGFYKATLWHRESNGSWRLTGSTDEYKNPIMIEVASFSGRKDKYEDNNGISSATELNLEFDEPSIIFEADSANFHTTYDNDYYKILLENKYRYSIKFQAWDKHFSPGDSGRYTADAIIQMIYEIGDSTSPTFDDNSYYSYSVDTAQSIYFYVKPYHNYESSLGTYKLRLEIQRERKVLGKLETTENIDFGDVKVGEKKSKEIVLTNTSSVEVNIFSMTCPEGFSGGWQGVLAPGQSKSIEISFGPSSAKLYSGYIQVESDAAGGTKSIRVTGNGTGSSIDFSDDLKFGDVIVSYQKLLFLTIYNTGDYDVDVYSIDCPDDFTCDWSGLIYAGQRQSVEVYFHPSMAKDYSDSIRIISNVESGKTSVFVSGRGVDPNSVIEGGEDISEIAITPNPATESILVALKESDAALRKISIINPAGAELVVENNVNESQIEIDLSAFSSGVYFLVVETYDGRRFAEKFIVVK